jgi:hypothetical protein
MTAQALWDAARGTGHTPAEYDAWGQKVTTEADAVNDHLANHPTGGGAPAWPQTPTPLGLVAWDDFQRTGALGGSTSPSGHVWTSHAGTWTADNGVVRAGDGANPTIATVNTTITSPLVEFTSLTTSQQMMGVTVAWIDVNNWIGVLVSGALAIRIWQRIGGTLTELASQNLNTAGSQYLDVGYAARLQAACNIRPNNLQVHATYTVGDRSPYAVSIQRDSGTTFTTFTAAAVTGRTGLYTEGLAHVGTRFAVRRLDGGLTA